MNQTRSDGHSKATYSTHVHTVRNKVRVALEETKRFCVVLHQCQIFPTAIKKRPSFPFRSNQILQTHFCCPHFCFSRLTLKFKKSCAKICHAQAFIHLPQDTAYSTEGTQDTKKPVYLGFILDLSISTAKPIISHSQFLNCFLVPHNIDTQQPKTLKCIDNTS